MIKGCERDRNEAKKAEVRVRRRKTERSRDEKKGMKGSDARETGGASRKLS